MCLWCGATAAGRTSCLFNATRCTAFLKATKWGLFQAKMLCSLFCSSAAKSFVANKISHIFSTTSKTSRSFFIEKPCVWPRIFHPLPPPQKPPTPQVRRKKTTARHKRRVIAFQSARHGAASFLLKQICPPKRAKTCNRLSLFIQKLLSSDVEL